VEYVIHIGIFVCIYYLLATSLDLVAGHTGLLSFAHASFFAIGAYVSAIIGIRLGAPFIVGAIVAAVSAGLLSLLVSSPSLRLRDDYFILVTFAFQMIVFGVLNNWIEVTGGALGVSGILQPELGGFKIDSHLGFFLLSAGTACAGHCVVWRLVGSPFGRVLRAIREDEGLAQAWGKNPFRFKVTVFLVSAMMAALAGVLYAHYITYIDPSSFTVTESILIIAMVVIGGAGSSWGPLVGAAVLVTLPELLRFVGLPSSVAANLRQIIYGGLLVMMMLFRPRGLVGKYAFSH